MILMSPLVFGFFMVPVRAEAGFFSSILGNEVLASATGLDLAELDKNSQNMSILQANTSPLTFLLDKKTKSDSKLDAVSVVQEDESISISDNALVPATKGQEVVDPHEDESFDETSVYVVRKGDSIASIAKLFDISTDTILSVNNFPSGTKTVKEGEVLLILAYSGVEHTVAKGQTLSSIAKLYKVETEDILDANDLSSGAKLTVGDKLMIPGGSFAENSKPNTSKPKTGTSIAISTPKIDISGYFTHPLPNSKRTRGPSSKPKHEGVDFAAPTGTPIRAAASGRVLIARTGWNGKYGTLVVIQHNNGTQTLYAHMSRLETVPGEQVSQGEVIGYVGNTGRSTGPHLHFEVKGAKNPF